MMKSVSVWKQELAGGAHTERLASLYCCAPEQTSAQAARYAAVLDGLEKTFGAHTEAGLYSAPGRTEIGGNHTDHQHGRVLAGSVNIDMIAAAAPNRLNQLRVQSEGYDLCVIDLADLTARKEEENTSAAILRGECKAFQERGASLSGLDVYISSNVPKGSGVSSSAAFEVLIGVILNDCFMTEKVSPIAIAQIGQWAENVYFGKPCGLMDQMASSVGNIITIDFADPAHPVVEPVQVDFSKAGLALCILDSGADHADLTDEYAAIPNECRAVAAVCGGEVLRDVSFRAEPGQLVAVLGPNGAGKSTLFRCMLGFLSHYQGSISLCGRDVRHLSRRELARLAAYIPQSSQPLFDYTVRDTVLMGAAGGLEPLRQPGRQQLETAQQQLKRKILSMLS